MKYPVRARVHFVPGKEGGKGTWKDDPGGTGREIVREVTACPSCAASSRATRADEIEADALLARQRPPPTWPDRQAA